MGYRLYFIIYLAGFLNGWSVLHIVSCRFILLKLFRLQVPSVFGQLSRDGHFTDVLGGFCGLSEHELQGKT